MKTPRIADFDPNATIPELRSPLEGMPSIHKPQAVPTPTEPERPNGRTLQRPNGKRIITRNSFEIYEDQMDALRRLAYKDLELKGKIGSMSSMVREAIDSYINKHSSEK